MKLCWGENVGTKLCPSCSRTVAKERGELLLPTISWWLCSPRLAACLYKCRMGKAPAKGLPGYKDVVTGGRAARARALSSILHLAQGHGAWRHPNGHRAQACWLEHPQAKAPHLTSPHEAFFCHLQDTFYLKSSLHEHNFSNYLLFRYLPCVCLHFSCLTLTSCFSTAAVTSSPRINSCMGEIRGLHP